jgi:hypothetical protein
MYWLEAYQKACNHLVAFGSYGGDRAQGRKLIADALRVIRAKYGREAARRERYHMLFISGQFPVKCGKGE